MHADLSRPVVVLGSTGSIGTQALDVIAANPASFRVVALAAGGGRVDLLAEQAARFGVEAVAVADAAAVPALKEALAARGAHPEVLAGPDGVAEAATWTPGTAPATWTRGTATGTPGAAPATWPPGAASATGTPGAAPGAPGAVSATGTHGTPGTAPGTPGAAPGTPGVPPAARTSGAAPVVPGGTFSATGGAAASAASLPGAAWVAGAAPLVLNGITGALGLTSTLAALEAGRTLALANKESLIIGGPLVKRLAKPGQILPVDSEHSALQQALWAAGPTGYDPAAVRKLIVTASGGPFRGKRRSELSDVTPEMALAHPTWSMGPVITINSATLVNKGLEVIEAHLLFDIGFDRIEVVVHPQSIIHSMVEYIDGSTMAQASPPDMRLPIALALGHPHRVDGAARAVDWTTAHTWTFEPLDNEAFPSVELARHVGAEGGTAPAVYNAANEVCVEAFMRGALPFLAIVDTVARVVEEHQVGPADSVEEVLAADAWARSRASELTGVA